MFRTKVGSLMFNVTRRVSVTGERCRDPRGCECGTSEHAQTVCGYVECSAATCCSPLRPQGHCCYDYCGAVITGRGMSRGLVSIRPIFAGRHCSRWHKQPLPAW